MKFGEKLEKIAYTRDIDRVFSDFLTLVVCTCSIGEEEEEYMRIAKKYKREEMFLFSEELGVLIMLMDDNGNGLVDVLGGYYEENISRGTHGQFFTPFALCELMSALVQPEGGSFSDPCCGSGRLLLSSAKANRNLIFYAADIAEVCCKMTLINMCLNGLRGVVSWQNTLSLEVFQEWRVSITLGVPRISRIKPVKKIEIEPDEPIEAVIIPPKIEYRRFV